MSGIEDHVRVALSIPPKRAVAEMVGQLKGGSSHFVPHEIAPEVGFAWQREYGALSFSERGLPKVVAYIRNQRQHHAADTLWPGLLSPARKPQGA